MHSSNHPAGTSGGLGVERCGDGDYFHMIAVFRLRHTSFSVQRLDGRMEIDCPEDRTLLLAYKPNLS